MSDVEHNLIRILAVGAASAFGIAVAAAPVHAEREPNFIVGTPGNDVLIGTNHRDFIVGRRGEDRLVGRMQDDVLVGGPADDILRAATPLGHSGRDVLRGGRGHDRCIGDRGDVFRGCEVIRIRPG
jgi:Ca2+-binding RTX toxin-like protein